MIRAVLGTIMMRSIEHDRPLPAWLRAAAKRSRRLNDLERRLRLSHARLTASTAGVIGPAPQGLAARTVAALPLRPRPTVGAIPTRGRWITMALAATGAVAAAAAVTLVVLPSITPAASPAPDGPSRIAGTDTGAAEGPWAPETLISVFRVPDEVTTAGDLTGGLMTEAQRLRDDTRAAADFVLSRLRMLGAPPRQSGG